MKKSCALYYDGCCLNLEYSKQSDSEISFTSTFIDDEWGTTYNNWPSVPTKYRKMMVDNLLKQGWFQANPTDITIDNIPVVVVPKVMSMQGLVNLTLYFQDD